MREKGLYGVELLRLEQRKSFLFFLQEANKDKKSKGYGLIRDKNKKDIQIASISSVGYGLAGMVIGVVNNWITYEEAYIRVKGTLETFVNHVEQINGFYYHFINMKTGKREWNCEVSLIDTTIFIYGALTAGEFFKGEIKQLAEKLYQRIQWQWYFNSEENLFYMGYTPESGFFGQWDMYAEQLMVYIIACASPTFPISTIAYEKMKKPKGEYKQIKEIIHSFGGTLFTYQYSHCWIDFRNTKDMNGIDWFENSTKAVKANREYCIDNDKKYKTYHKNSWGLTACLGPKGYNSDYGALPSFSIVEKYNDGTVATSGAEGSIVFMPKEVMDTLEYYYHQVPKLWGKYGFKNAYNLEGKKEWYAEEYIGIDKGISLLMIENYLSNTIWNLIMNNKYIKKGLKELKIKEIKTKQI